MADRVIRARGARRRTHWFSVFGGATETSSVVRILWTSVGSNEGETIVRVRGILALTLLAATSIGDGYEGAFGIAVVTTAAAAGGSGSVPTPLTEAGWDGWLLHRFFSVRSNLGGEPDGQVLELDSKAMRKLTADESLVGVTEVEETGTSQLLLSNRVRILSMTG